MAECILASGKSDLVTIGRALPADPDLPMKFAEKRDAELRPYSGPQNSDSVLSYTWEQK